VACRDGLLLQGLERSHNLVHLVLEHNLNERRERGSAGARARRAAISAKLGRRQHRPRKQPTHLSIHQHLDFLGFVAA